MKQAFVVVLSVALAIGATATVEQNRMKHMAPEKDAQALLSDWQAAHFVIRFTNGRPYWFFDATNALEVDWTKRIKPLLVISRSDGHILERSPLYRSLGLPTSPAAGSAPRIWTSGDRYPLHRPDGGSGRKTISANNR